MNSTQLSDLVVAVLDDNKAQEIVKLDVRELTNVTDYMIVASGTSNRHVRALIEHVTEKAREAGRRPIGVEGEDGGEWVLLDLDDTHQVAAHRQGRVLRRRLQDHQLADPEGLRRHRVGAGLRRRQLAGTSRI